LHERAVREEWDPEEIDVLKRRLDRLVAHKLSALPLVDVAKEASDQLKTARDALDAIDKEVVAAEAELVELRDKQVALRSEVEVKAKQYEELRAKLSVQDDAQARGAARLQGILSDIVADYKAGRIQDPDTAFNEAIKIAESFKSSSSAGPSAAPSPTDGSNDINMRAPVDVPDESKSHT